MEGPIHHTLIKESNIVLLSLIKWNFKTKKSTNPDSKNNFSSFHLCSEYKEHVCNNNSHFSRPLCPFVFSFTMVKMKYYLELWLGKSSEIFWQLYAFQKGEKITPMEVTEQENKTDAMISMNGQQI